MVYAPGMYTGYGAKTLPGIREAIEQSKWPEADVEIGLVGRVLSEEAALIDRATAIMKQVVKEAEKR
jgi:N-acetylated-alpha-linked acidic dipeptidase